MVSRSLLKQTLVLQKIDPKKALLLKFIWKFEGIARLEWLLEKCHMFLTKMN